MARAKAPASKANEASGHGRAGNGEKAPAPGRLWSQFALGGAQSLGSGQPLDAAARSYFEPRLGADLGDVRVHTGAAAAASAAGLRARAYTLGNDVVFSEDRYSPGTAGGQRLLAHELAHVVQQRHAPADAPAAAPEVGHGDTPAEVEADRVADAVTAGAAASPRLHAPLSIQRDPDPDAADASDTVTEFAQDDAYVRIWPGRGFMSVSLIDPRTRVHEPWVTVRWAPRATTYPKVDVASRSGAPRVLAIGVKAAVDIDVTVNRVAEMTYAYNWLGGVKFVHQYVGGGRRVTVNEHLPGGGEVTAKGDFKRDDDHPGRPINVELETAPPPPRAKALPPFWWEFDDVRQLDKFAAAHPQYYWVMYEGGSGPPYKAQNFTERDMQRLADRFRDDPAFADGVKRVYENGVAWEDTEWLFTLFYSSENGARIGTTGDGPESIIYRHGAASFGRKSVTHSEALTLWQWYEGYATRQGASAVRRMPVERGTFYTLFAIGNAGTECWVDQHYFDLRAEFFRKIPEFEARSEESIFDRPENMTPSILGGASFVWWRELLREEREIWSHYLRVALDRDELAVDEQLQRVIASDKGFVLAVGQEIYDRVEEWGRQVAIRAIEGAQSGLEFFFDRQNLAALLYKLPFLDFKKRLEALQYLGVPITAAVVYALELRDREVAIKVALGEEHNGFTLEYLHDVVAKQHAEMEPAKKMIREHGVNPLDLDDEFGEEVRRQTYKAFGFQLEARNYPHEGDVGQRKGTWRALIFGSEAGYLYARVTANDAKNRRIVKYITIGLAVLAAVLLVIFAAYAAAALAGLLFAEGTLLFIGTELVVTAAIVTAVGPALNTFIMSHGQATAADYARAYGGIGWQFLINLGTFGLFKAIGWGARAVATTGAGGKAAFEVSKAWQAAEVAMRIGASAPAMYMISVIHYAIENDGKLPEGQSLDEIIFETGLSIILLEVGGFLARPSMTRLQKWARDQRLGTFPGEIADLRIRISELNHELAAFGAGGPVRGKTEARLLLSRQRALVEQQLGILERMRATFRTRSDAKILEEQMAPELAHLNARLQIIVNAEGFAKAEVRPAGIKDNRAEFTYKRGHEQDIKDLYGEKNVKDAGTHLLVAFEGKEMIFRPATDAEAGILPDGTRNPAALRAWQVKSAQRQHEVVKGAAETAAREDVFRDVTKAEPREMDVKALREFEKLLSRAEKRLQQHRDAGHDQLVDTSRSTDLKDWRNRIHSEHGRLTRRAKLLGLEGTWEIQQLAELRLDKRMRLNAADLEAHLKVMEEARKVIDKAEALKLGTLEGLAKGPKEDIEALQAGLQTRKADVKRRAGMYGWRSSNVREAARLAIGGRETVESLAQAEATISAAEVYLDKQARIALERGRAQHGGETIDQLRAMPGMEKLTDAQVGDILHLLRQAGRLSPAALRGAMYTLAVAKGSTPIPLENVVAFSRSLPEMEWVLDFYGRMRDAQIEGSHEVLRDAAGSPDKWQGGVWQMEVARIIGLEKIAAFEFRIDTATGGREVDILLKDRTRIETKDWRTWYGDKVAAQFYTDLDAATAGGTDPAGMAKIRWMFRPPTPVDVSLIRSTMRTALEKLITDNGLDPTQASALRDAFDAHTKLLEVPKIEPSQVVMEPWTPPPVHLPHPVPPVPDQDHP